MQSYRYRRLRPAATLTDTRLPRGAPARPTYGQPTLHPAQIGDTVPAHTTACPMRPMGSVQSSSRLLVMMTAALLASGYAASAASTGSGHANANANANASAAANMQVALTLKPGPFGPMLASEPEPDPDPASGEFGATPQQASTHTQVYTDGPSKPCGTESGAEGGNGDNGDVAALVSSELALNDRRLNTDSSYTVTTAFSQYTNPTCVCTSEYANGYNYYNGPTSVSFTITDTLDDSKTVTGITVVRGSRANCQRPRNVAGRLCSVLSSAVFPSTLPLTPPRPSPTSARHPPSTLEPTPPFVTLEPPNISMTANVRSSLRHRKYGGYGRRDRCRWVIATTNVSRNHWFIRPAAHPAHHSALPPARTPPRSQDPILHHTPVFAAQMITCTWTRLRPLPRTRRRLTFLAGATPSS